MVDSLIVLKGSKGEGFFKFENAFRNMTVCFLSLEDGDYIWAAKGKKLFFGTMEKNHIRIISPFEFSPESCGIFKKEGNAVTPMLTFGNSDALTAQLCSQGGFLTKEAESQNYARTEKTQTEFTAEASANSSQHEERNNSVTDKTSAQLQDRSAQASNAGQGSSLRASAQSSETEQGSSLRASTQPSETDQGSSLRASAQSSETEQGSSLRASAQPSETEQGNSPRASAQPSKTEQGSSPSASAQPSKIEQGSSLRASAQPSETEQGSSLSASTQPSETDQASVKELLKSSAVPNTYFDCNRDTFLRALKENPEEQGMSALIPGSKWVKIDGGEYIMGIIYDENSSPMYLCYGFPAFWSEEPPEKIDGYCQWIPENCSSPHERGYWVIYVNAVTGERVK